MSEFDTEQKPSRRLWILAAVGALALHICGGALAVAHLRTDDPDESLGAPAIEIGLELTSPRPEAADLPPGPDTEASVASPRPRRAEGRGQGDRPGEARARRGRRSGPGGGAERFEQAQRGRRENRRGADFSLDGVGGSGSDGEADSERYPGG